MCVKPDFLCAPIDFQGFSICSRNRLYLSVLSGGHHKVNICCKSFSSWHILLDSLCSHYQKNSRQISSAYWDIIFHEYNDRNAGQKPVDLWRTLVQPPTQSNVFTSAIVGQLWLCVAKSGKVPMTEMLYLWSPVPILQQSPCEEVLLIASPELPKLKSVVHCPLF